MLSDAEQRNVLHCDVILVCNIMNMLSVVAPIFILLKVHIFVKS